MRRKAASYIRISHAPALAQNLLAVVIGANWLQIRCTNACYCSPPLSENRKFESHFPTCCSTLSEEGGVTFPINN